MRYVIFFILYILFVKCFAQKDSISFIQPDAEYYLFLPETSVTKKNYMDTIYFKIKEGDIMVVKYFENGEKVRSESYFLENKNIYALYNYKNAKYNGICIKYYKNGKIADYCVYEDGKTLIPSIDFYPNGNVATVSTGHDSNVTLFNKFHIYFDSLGNVDTENFYRENGKIFSRIYYENGMLKMIVHSGPGISPYYVFHENGTKKQEGTTDFLPITFVGRWREWDEQGRLIVDGNYGMPGETDYGKKTGVWKYWSENNKLIKEEWYENGELKKTKNYLPGKKESVTQ